VAKELLRSGATVRVFDQAWTEENRADLLSSGRCELVEASVFDESALEEALEGIGTVLNFMSFSVPSTSPQFLANELQTTVRALDLILTAMVRRSVAELVFPSSGGTVYGEPTELPVREDAPLAPRSSYGMGKVLAEEMIRFYARAHRLRYQILRIANVFGALRLSRISQGAVDVFLQRVAHGEPIEIWGDGSAVRDYLFIDDLVAAVTRLLATEARSSGTYNVGSGAGHSLSDILAIIGRVTQRPTQVRYQASGYAGVSRITLDSSRFVELTGWSPARSLEDGIREAWCRRLRMSEGSTSSS
jgi:UDP-glucose 4-epimerase